VWRPQTPVFEVPYSVALVELDEGILVVSSIIGCTPEELVEGLEVAVEFHPSSDNQKLPYFRPIAAGPSSPSPARGEPTPA
jgi:uncharacterized OB-fold protein